jgi:hypothetical protein
MRRAGPGQLGDVLAVLDEAATWLGERGVRQWPARFERAWIEPGGRADPGPAVTVSRYELELLWNAPGDVPGS